MRLIKLLFAIIVVLLIGNVAVANTAVDESIVVKNVSAEIEALTQQNLALKQQIAQAGALTRVETHLEAMGFVESPKVMTLGGVSNVALR